MSTILFDTIEKSGTYDWKFAWTNVGNVDVWLHGQLLYENTDIAELTLTGDDQYEPPPLEVVDTGDDAQNYLYPCRATIQWRGDINAEHYRVEQDPGSGFVLRRFVTEDGSGYYQITTHVMEDVTDAKWRVIPVDSQGNYGGAIDVTVFVVCNPDPPSIEGTYVKPNLVISGR